MKKLNFFLPFFILFSQCIIGQPYDCFSEYNAPHIVFCGLYFGINVNFGSVNFLRQSCIFTETDTSFVDVTAHSQIFQNTKRDCGLRESINAIGAGFNFGWSWAKPGWYLCAEFNGIFYGNPCRGLTNDCCNDSCYNPSVKGYCSNLVSPAKNNKIFNCCDSSNNCDCCEEYLLTINSNNSVDGADFVSTTNIQYGHGYNNRARLDGVLKIGFLPTPCAALYLLGGGSGLSLKYKEFINVTNAGHIYTFHNNPNNSFCCTRWIGGGVVGAGIRYAWCSCLDVIVEGRYSKYKNICNFKSKSNIVDNSFPNLPKATITSGNIAEQDQTIFRTSAYLTVFGLNWRF